jgi:hypothetical protein
MTKDSEITQVYLVTSGSYSDYGISSVWLTVEEAQTAAAEYGRVEVWPIGEHKRTLGSFSRSVDIDAATGEVVGRESANNWPDYDESTRRVAVLCWDKNNRIGIRVTEPTQERADKVFGETKFRVFADIAQGLPKELIAESRYVNGTWVSTR